jgi:hypothetical protein
VTGAVPLTSYETATRLAYLLTGTMPDRELLAAAEAGPFTDATLEAQARRLLGSVPSRGLLRHFMARLLRYEGLGSPASSSNPTYTPEIAALTLQETGHFVEDVVFDGAGTFRALFSERSTWLNEPLARFYGISGVSGEAFRKVDRTGQSRAGILTQSAFLTATSPSGRANPVMRGLTVLRQVLCVSPPEPPVGVITPPEPDDPSATYRTRLERATSEPTCRACHRDVNQLGFAFENYDGVGLWRDLDNGLPIDASGTLSVTDAQGSFVGAVELSKLLAESEDAQACFVSNWLRYSYGRPVEPADDCTLETVQTAFRDSDGKVVEMLVALAKSDHLRYRLASELVP